jgi:hypothetical protein
MNANKLKILVMVMILSLAVLACGGSFSTAKIASAKMAADNAGTQATTVFAQDQTFYCIVDLANAPEDTKLKVVWTAVEAQGLQSNSLLTQTEETTGTGVSFHLSNKQLWPTGKYKVDLYLNDKLDRTLEFEVK